MLKGIAKALFGTRHDRELKRVQPILDEIHQHEERLATFSEEEVQAQTQKFRAILKERTEELERRIAELPDVQRAVVVLRTYDELPYREIAEILGTTETSARVSYHYALTKLRGWYLEEAKTK